MNIHIEINVSWRFPVMMIIPLPAVMVVVMIVVRFVATRQ
jgi:hypothetical protein